jgi:hypothetical protein
VGLLWYIAFRKAEFWMICLFIFKLTNIYTTLPLIVLLWSKTILFDHPFHHLKNIVFLNSNFPIH